MYGKYEFEISKLNNGNYFDSLTNKEIDVEFIYNKIKEHYKNGVISLTDIIDFDTKDDLNNLIEDFDSLIVANELEKM